MKVPFLNIWVTQTDWEREFNELSIDCDTAIRVQNEKILWLQNQVSENKQPRDSKGLFISKTALKVKQIHDQLRAEVYAEPQPSDTFLTGNYDDIKKASEV